MNNIELDDMIITPEEALLDETPEEVAYYIDLKIHLIIKELKAGSSYQEIKENILDDEINFNEEFYNKLKAMPFDPEHLYKLIEEEAVL